MPPPTWTLAMAAMVEAGTATDTAVRLNSRLAVVRRVETRCRIIGCVSLVLQVGRIGAGQASWVAPGPGPPVYSAATRTASTFALFQTAPDSTFLHHQRLEARYPRRSGARRQLGDRIAGNHKTGSEYA